MVFAKRGALRVAMAAGLVAVLGVTGVGLRDTTPARAAGECSVDNAALDGEEAAFLSLINQYRSAHGLGALSTSANLMRSATWLAADMGARGYFSHTDRLGRNTSTRARDCGYPGPAGENIAAGSNWETGQDAFNAWRDSPSHNENMLNAPYTKIGIARVYVPGSQYLWYWVTDFGFNDDGTTADLPYTGPEYGIRSADLAPGRWNMATVLPAGLRVSDLQGWTAWDPLPNGNYQQWGASDYIPGGTRVGLMPAGMSMDRGRSPR